MRSIAATPTRSAKQDGLFSPVGFPAGMKPSRPCAAPPRRVLNTPTEGRSSLPTRRRDSHVPTSTQAHQSREHPRPCGAGSPVTGGAFAATGGNGNGGGSSTAKASASTGRTATFTAVAAKKKTAPKPKAGAAVPPDPGARPVRRVLLGRLVRRGLVAPRARKAKTGRRVLPGRRVNRGCRAKTAATGAV